MPPVIGVDGEGNASRQHSRVDVTTKRSPFTAGKMGVAT